MQQVINVFPKPKYPYIFISKTNEYVPNFRFKFSPFIKCVYILFCIDLISKKAASILNERGTDPWRRGGGVFNRHRRIPGNLSSRDTNKASTIFVLIFSCKFL